MKTMIRRSLYSKLFEGISPLVKRIAKRDERDLIAVITSGFLTVDETVKHFPCRQKAFHTSALSMHGGNSESNDKVMDCWNCGTRIEQQKLFCKEPSCGAVQALSPQDANLFDIFQLPRTYDIDLTQLESAYKSLQKTLHPDKFATKSPSEKDKSTVTSSTINSAFETLRSPVQRAEYMVWLAFGKTMSEERTVQDPELMMEVFELREELQGVRDQAGLLRLQTQLQEQAKQAQSDFAVRFAAKNEEESIRLAMRLRYLHKMLEEIHARLE